MRVVIETNRLRRMAEVWVIRDELEAASVLVIRAGVPTWKRVDDGEEPDPTLVLPVDVLEALVAEGQGLVRHSDHVIDALADARTVRDRLLTLVEEGWHD